MEEAITVSLSAGQAAAGFRAWFILQHYYGYRPFTTELKKTFPNIEGVIPKG